MKTMILKILGFIAFLAFVFFVTFLVPYGVGWAFFPKNNWGMLYISGLATIIGAAFVLFVIGGIFYMAWKFYIDFFWGEYTDHGDYPI